MQKRPLDNEDAIFWLYVAIREELLPLSYYNNMIEAAIVMGDVFNWMFEKIDKQSYEIFGQIPGTVFQKHFTTLFAEMEDKLALAIMDLIYVFGSGCMRGTLAQGMEPVTEEYPLCRT